MLYTSKGIILKKVKYSDHTYIVHIFTEAKGHQTFIYSRSKKKSNKNAAFLYPLTLVEVNANLNPKKDIQHINSIQIEVPFQSIPFNPVKSFMAQFLAEVYFECIKNDLKNTDLFSFLHTSVQILDIIEHNINLFHLKNLMELTRQMGFYPDRNYSELRPYFNLLQGKFSSKLSNESINKDTSLQFWHLMDIKEIESYKPQLYFNKGELIDAFLSYYELHLSGFKKPRSLDIFRMLI